GLYMVDSETQGFVFLPLDRCTDGTVEADCKPFALILIFIRISPDYGEWKSDRPHDFADAQFSARHTLGRLDDGVIACMRFQVEVGADAFLALVTSLTG